jgi:hypothetical protein
MKSVTYVFAMLALFACCKRSDSVLPPATNNGSNTFGCMLDGKPWTPSGPGLGTSVFASSGGFVHDQDGKLVISIKAWTYNDTICFKLIDCVAGNYSLETDCAGRTQACGNHGYLQTTQGSYYSTDFTNRGRVTITHADTVTKVVSGTFEMTLFSNKSSNMALVTNGRFDFLSHL